MHQLESMFFFFFFLRIVTFVIDQLSYLLATSYNLRVKEVFFDYYFYFEILKTPSFFILNSIYLSWLGSIALFIP